VPDLHSSGGGQSELLSCRERRFTRWPRIGYLALSRHRDLEVPQAPEAHDPTDGEDHAGQKQGEFEASKKRVHRRIKCAPVDIGRGSMDLTTRNVGSARAARSCSA
jgi:hypothetical protein